MVAVRLSAHALSGGWSAEFYREVDPNSDGEPVPMFWQAIAREFLERWAHQSQIRRALGHPSLADSPVLEIGFQIIATVAGMPATFPASTGERWSIGPIVLGGAQQAADILTLAYTEDEVQALAEGPSELVAQFASRVGRRG